MLAGGCPQKFSSCPRKIVLPDSGFAVLSAPQLVCAYVHEKKVRWEIGLNVFNSVQTGGIDHSVQCVVWRSSATATRVTKSHCMRNNAV